MYVYPRDYEYLGYGDFLVDSTNIFQFDSIDLNPISGDFSGKNVQSADIRVEDGDIRFRMDKYSTDVSSLSGTLLQSLETLTIRGYGNINRFRAIAIGVDVKLKVHFGYGGSSSKPA